MSLLKRILRHEGFSEYPYIDPVAKRGIPPNELAVIEKHWPALHTTLGHGITYLTKAESREIVKGRISELEQDLAMRISFFYDLPREVQDVLVEMAYQMGVSGVMRFRKTINALQHDDYGTAAAEMLNSRWYAQTPERAKSLARVVRSFKL